MTFLFGFLTGFALTFFIIVLAADKKYDNRSILEKIVEEEYENYIKRTQQNEKYKK